MNADQLEEMEKLKRRIRHLESVCHAMAAALRREGYLSTAEALEWAVARP